MQTGAPCLLFNKRIRDVMLTTIFSSCCKQWILNNMQVLLFCQDYVNVTYNHRQVHNIRIINSMLKMPIKHNNQCWQTLIYLWRVQPSQNKKCNQLCIKCNFRYEILNKQTCLTLHPTIYNIIYIFNGQPKRPLLLCTPAFVVLVLSSSVTLAAAGKEDGRTSKARGRSCGRHRKAVQYGYVPLERHVVIFTIILATLIFWLHWI